MRVNFWEYIISMNIISVLALILLLACVCVNPLFNRKQARLFIVAIVAILVAIVAVALDTYVSALKNPPPGFITLRRVTSFLNFSLSPVMPFIMLLIFSDGKLNKYFSIPLILNTILCFLSVFFKIVFQIADNNAYDRGVLFFFPFAVALFYVAMVIFKNSSIKTNLKIFERLFLLIAIGLLVLAMVLETVFYFRMMVWNMSAMITLAYYLVLNILSRVVDPLTGIFNRAMYNKTIQEYDGKTKCLLSILDINDFKMVNDTKGHAEGDRFLIDFALCLNKHMMGVASVYRIGGDEFFCISKKLDLVKFKHAIDSLNDDCNRRNIFFSYGVACYSADCDITDTIDEIDALMYKNKQEYKQKKHDENHTLV